jgi:pimeloyl-ACP methyl ester carboxylesterase
VNAQRRHIEVRGRTASYREAGSGIVAVMTAGLGLTSRFYAQSYDAFARAGIHLIVPDLPGWGDTPGPRTGLAPADTAAFLLDFADALHIRRAVWIGHSLGAQPVIHLAGRRPDIADAVILVGPTGAPGRFRLIRQARGLALEAVRAPARVIGAVAREYLTTSPVRYAGTWLRHSRDITSDRLYRIRCPTLILAGDEDAVCSPAFVELLRHRIPRAEVEWVRGGSHALPRAHAAEFNRAVIAFIHRSRLPA